MKVTLKHGAELETISPAEAQELLNGIREQNAFSRVRATASILLDGTGAGQDEVYAVPLGFELSVRRVTVDLDTAADPSTGNVPLNVAGKSIEYLRSGTRIEYGVPSSPNAVPQVPGAQTWGAEQGPYLRNGEVFEVRARGLTVGSRLSVIMEGVLHRGSERKLAK